MLVLEHFQPSFHFVFVAVIEDLLLFFDANVLAIQRFVDLPIAIPLGVVVMPPFVIEDEHLVVRKVDFDTNFQLKKVLRIKLY